MILRPMLFRAPSFWLGQADPSPSSYDQAQRDAILARIKKAEDQAKTLEDFIAAHAQTDAHLEWTFDDVTRAHFWKLSADAAKAYPTVQDLKARLSEAEPGENWYPMTDAEQVALTTFTQNVAAMYQLMLRVPTKPPVSVKPPANAGVPKDLLPSAPPTPPAVSPTGKAVGGLSTTTKVLIGAGVVAGIGLLGLLIKAA